MGESAFYFGGRFVSLITSLLFGTKLTDQPTGYKIFHKDLIPILIGAQHNGFEWEAEITAKILKRNIQSRKSQSDINLEKQERNYSGQMG